MTVRVAALTGGRRFGPARFRVDQHRMALAGHGIVLEIFPARFGSHPPVRRWMRPFWGVASLVGRIPAVARSHRYDVTLLQRELISTLATLERFTHRPRVFDVDDALWLHRRGSGVRRIAASCEVVVCGNAFLAEHFSRWAPRVTVIPTAVDTDRFTPAEQPAEPVIVWTGSSSGLPYVYGIEDALAAVLEARPRARLRIVADEPPRFRRLPVDRVEYVPWSPGTEVQPVRDAAVGVMPLADTDWERGKCSFKMLLYMSCGIPAVVSPVGMNREILNLGECGVAANTQAEWRDALIGLLDNPAHGRLLGRTGRQIVEDRFSVPVVAAALARVLRSVA